MCNRINYLKSGFKVFHSQSLNPAYNKDKCGHSIEVEDQNA